jgi:streptomycin 6-kinase
VRLPAGVLGMAARDETWADWVGRLPRLTDELLAEWGLAVDGLPMHGYCSLVVPVRTATLTTAVLKITYDGDVESEHEHLALQHWGGRGAVRLLRADPRRRALLLERLPQGDLRDLWDVEACEVVAGLYPRLHLPALPQLRTVASYVERWTAPLASLPRDAPIPHRLVAQTISLVRDLLADQGDLRMVHGDLHYFNVLAADREPWLVIDPKPMAGDPHYEPAPMLWNRFDELGAPRSGQSVRNGVRRRFHTLVDAAGLDEDRARDWVVVRMVLDAHWSIEDAERQHRSLTAEERDWITRCIAIAKAVQD